MALRRPAVVLLQPAGGGWGLVGPVSTPSNICRNQRKVGVHALIQRCVCVNTQQFGGEFFFFKHANMQHVGGSHGLKSFQRESIHAFQMEYLSIERVHEPGGEINLCDDV